MSQQIQITGGAKVRDLNDVIIGTNGVLSSLAFNVANGVPKLDSNGKILVSQLPNSVMEYLGTWNAATNTPTLANGVGNQGDVYLCNVAGTVNFGAGPITFAVGDTAIYSGSIWQKAGGATGTVTSVGLSTSGNAFTIGSSPVTTSGTITINGAGTASQYINGAGNLTTFPTLITSIGLSMPSAFSVSNSPLTANGTISVTGAGTVSQYIDGTGALQSFPSLTGYVPYVGATTDVDLGVHVLNAQALHVKGTAGAGHLGLKHQTATPTGSANESLVFANVDGDLGWQNGNLYSTILNTHSNTANRVYTFPDSSGTIALTSDLSSYVPYTGATTDVNLGGNRLFAKTLTAEGSVSSSGSLNLKQNDTISVAGVNYGTIATNTLQQFVFYWENASYAKRFNLDFSALTPLGTARTYSLPDASGTIALVGGSGVGTVTSVAALTLGTSGTDLNSTVANSTTTPVITLNVPDASATARGVITTGTQTIAGGKTFTGFASFQSSSGTNTQYGIYLGKGSTPTAFSSSNVNIYSDVTTNNLVIRDNLSTANLVFNNSTQTYTFPASTGTIALTSDLSSYVPTTRTISTTAPLQGGGDLSANRTLSITQATTSTNGYLSSTDWNTFNGKQNALTNPVTGTGTSGQVTYFNGTTSVTSSGSLTWDNTNSALSSPVYYALNTTGAAFNLSNNGDNVGKIQNVTATSWSLAYGAGNLTYPKGTNVLTWDTTNKVTFAGTLSNGTYTYTLPSATGTLALTSDLSSYLPLTGGTLTGQLYINPTNTATVGLDVASNTIRFRSDNLEGFKRQLEITMGSGTLVQCVAKGYGANYGTDLAFYTATTSGVNGSPAMYITSSNRIGILTGTPSYTLDVTGTGRFTSTLTGAAASFGGNLSVTGNNFFTLATTNTSARIGEYDATNRICFTANQNSADAQDDATKPSWGLVFNANSTDTAFIGHKAAGGGSAALTSLMTITGAGNVGIGTSTLTAGIPLSINVATGNNCNVAFQENASDKWYLRNITSSNAFSFYSVSGGAEIMRLTSAGNVGIGTTSNNSNKLQIGSMVIPYAGNEFAIGNGTIDFAIDLTATSTDIYSSAAMSFATSTTERMRITSGGLIIKATDNSTTGQFQIGGQTGSPPNAILVSAADQNGPYPIGVKALSSSQGCVGFFDSANATQGSITISGSTVSYNSFLGSHYSQLQDNSKPEILKGTVLEAIDELCEWDGETNDRLAKVKISDTSESKNVYGIFLGWDNTDEFNDMYVAALGAGYIRVNQNEVISMGDLLQSNGDGTAKVQSDDIMRSSTIAKVVSTQKIETYEDGSYLIAATLHCG